MTDVLLRVTREATVFQSLVVRISVDDVNDERRTIQQIKDSVPEAAWTSGKNKEPHWDYEVDDMDDDFPGDIVDVTQPAEEDDD